MEFRQFDEPVGLPDRPLDPPWDRTLAPANWPDVGGVEVTDGRVRSRKRVTVNGVVVKNEEGDGGRSQHLVAEAPLTDYIGTSWGLLSGRPRLVVTTVRPARELAGEVTGTLTVDGEPVPYHRLDPRFNEAERFGPLAWVIVFEHSGADVTIAGLEVDEIPLAWASIETLPLRAARRFVLGFT
jgi:hypothetical protein